MGCSYGQDLQEWGLVVGDVVDQGFEPGVSLADESLVEEPVLELSQRPVLVQEVLQLADCPSYGMGIRRVRHLLYLCESARLV